MSINTLPGCLTDPVNGSSFKELLNIVFIIESVLNLCQSSKHTQCEEIFVSMITWQSKSAVRQSELSCFFSIITYKEEKVQYHLQKNYISINIAIPKSWTLKGAKLFSTQTNHKRLN